MSMERKKYVVKLLFFFGGGFGGLVSAVIGFSRGVVVLLRWYLILYLVLYLTAVGTGRVMVVSSTRAVWLCGCVAVARPRLRGCAAVGERSDSAASRAPALGEAQLQGGVPLRGIAARLWASGAIAQRAEPPRWAKPSCKGAFRCAA